MGGKFNPSTLETGFTDNGYPKVQYSFFENGETINTTIEDRGYLLYLTSKSFPAFGQQVSQPVSELSGNHSPLISNAKLSAQVLTSCGGLSNNGNPFGCCGIAPNDGNCTFAAWELARQYWGYQLPMRGNASTWYSGAQSAGIPTSPTVALFSVAVSTTLSAYGHVGLVTAVNGPSNNRIVTLREEQCLSPNPSLPLGDRTWGIGNFTGYILNPAVNNQSIIVYSKSPSTLYASTTDQQVLFSASNVQGNIKAIVIFPSGYVATLEPSAQIWIYGYQTVGTRMRLSEQGTYSIQFFNTTGVFSGMYYFTVN